MKVSLSRRTKDGRKGRGAEDLRRWARWASEYGREIRLFYFGTHIQEHLLSKISLKLEVMTTCHDKHIYHSDSWSSVCGCRISRLTGLFPMDSERNPIEPLSPQDHAPEVL